MKEWKTSLQSKIRKQEQRGLLRRRRVRKKNKDPHFDFSSNDYLGLAHHSSVLEEIEKDTGKFGSGSTGSQYLSGYTSKHSDLEHRLCELTGRSKALLFSSGYLANIGVLTALGESFDNIITDKLCHASIIDGARSSKATLKRFKHNDYKHLKSIIEKERKNIIVVEGVYSMDGDQACLKKIVQINHSKDAMTYVDDAHGFGVYGEAGAGSLSAQDITENEVPLMMAGFGKAIGLSGAFIAGDDLVIRFLEQFTRTAIYSTSLPTCIVSGVLKALDIIEKEGWRREKAFELAEYFKSRLKDVCQLNPNAHGPIQLVMIGDDKRAARVSKCLHQNGYSAPAIRTPTVPTNSARVRVSITARHEKKDIEGLAETIKRSL